MKNKNIPLFFYRNAMAERVTRCYFSDGEKAELKTLREKSSKSEDDQKKITELEKKEFVQVVKEATSKEFDAKIKGYEKQISDLKELVEKSATSEDVTKIKDALVIAEATIKAMKENGGKLSKAGSNIKEQLEKAMTDKKDAFEKFKSGESKNFTVDIDLKSAATMLESGSLNSSNYLPNPQIMPGYIDLVRNQPLLETYANNKSVSSPTIVIVNKYNAQGTAAMTAEGAAVPLVSAELKSENATAYLIGAYEKISIQMLSDIDFMASFIEQELRYQVNIAVDNLLLTGSGSSTIKGITIYAVGFTISTVTTTNANNFDAIVAVIAQQKSLNFTPTNVFINPLDAANMKLTKDLYGRTMWKEYVVDGKIDGVLIVESNQVAVGHVGVYDMTKFNIFNLLGLQIQYGWENDDFRKNLVSLSGIRRLATYISLNHLNGFVYDTFANIKTAIAPTP